jgi:hypothetical protein
MFAALLEVVVLSLVVLFIGTQILVPAMRGRALFPMFRKEAKIEAEVVEVEQAIHEEELKNIVKSKKRQLNKVKKGVK